MDGGEKQKAAQGWLRHCNFCGKNEQEAFVLVAGPAVFICDECNDLVGSVIKKHKVGYGLEGRQMSECFTKKDLLKLYGAEEVGGCECDHTGEVAEKVRAGQNGLRDKVPLISEMWSTVDAGFSPTSGRLLASVVDFYGRIVAADVLKEDAEFIANAVNKVLEVRHG